MKVVKSFDDISDREKKLLYMSNVRPILNLRALFSDATAVYRNPTEPGVDEKVTIRLRTAKYNVDEASIVVNDNSIKMTRAYSDEIFDYYEASVHTGSDKIYYYFEVRAGKVRCYYNQIGVAKDLNASFNFQIIPGFKTPDWAKGIVMYQIFVDRFCNGDTSNDVRDGEYSYMDKQVNAVSDWNKYPEQVGIREFYGGDLQGVMNKLDYLQKLGVEAIYFNPLFVSPSNHKYDIQDYDYIDPHFGIIVEEKGEVLGACEQDNTCASMYINRVTNKKNLEASNAMFVKLIEEIHRRGMKVIIDGVFNHCGSFNKWLDREHIYSNGIDKYQAGASIEEQSPYHTFFKFYDNQWPENISYDGWWGNCTLPKLNYESSPKLEEYILNIGKKWVSPPFNVDGWRLDVAADLGYSKEYNHNFWKKFRKVIKEANSNALILAENYGDSYDWLQGDQWDTIMNYDAFMEPVTWFLTGMQKHSDEFREDMLGNADKFFDAMNHNMARLGGQSIAIAMNELSNHDHSRFLTRTNKTTGRIESKGSKAAEYNINKAVFKEAVVMQMTWPGAPTVYYGDEAGVCGWTDPDDRRTYPWGNEDEELIGFHTAVIKLHKENQALRFGSYKQLYAENNLISYGRFDAVDVIIIVVNNSDDERKVRIPAWELGLTYNDDVEQIFLSYDGGYSTEKLGYSIPNGYLEIGLRKTSAVILKKIK
ncbi:glycoside hydrolase family 13 protein [[Clostridium] fimetarium]|uniref:Alpha-glucosidase n=1 Tax=[Clostridium] fimetarium TaxID=99656 RepID=A0A1I0M3K8_9FIRM|nr:glycoside hydrolase family 13 protein [[Clostridium] fimetarium]SEV82316.1 alpha-glucosidase [[Clostridium] fimetarium]